MLRRVAWLRGVSVGLRVLRIAPWGGAWVTLVRRIWIIGLRRLRWTERVVCVLRLLLRIRIAVRRPRWTMARLLRGCCKGVVGCSRRRPRWWGIKGISRGAGRCRRSDVIEC